MPVDEIVFSVAMGNFLERLLSVVKAKKGTGGLAIIMVQLVIPTAQLCPQGSTPSDKDWILIELQGSLSSSTSGSLAGLELGRLEVRDNGKTTLYIGHHKLSGSRVELKAPLAVLRKQTSVSTITAMDIDQESFDDQPKGEHAEGPRSFDVVTLLRYKYHFKTRPEHLLAEEHKGLSDFKKTTVRR
ncbi:Ctf8-domain-containing protein [Gaertneriomyces semiglobifer]|nr:Ctf8-domain-containing protein [Gaertneriomyces semiglobifer]